LKISSKRFETSVFGRVRAFPPALYLWRCPGRRAGLTVVYFVPPNARLRFLVHWTTAMKELQSAFFKSEPSGKLRRALNNNPDHIMPGTRDPVIFFIQEALISLKEATRAQFSGESNFFGPNTTTAILAFKKKFIAKGERLDNNPIVGTGTVELLDRLLLQNQSAPIEPPKPKPSKDILVHVVGADPRTPPAGQETDGGQAAVGIPSVAGFAKLVNNPNLVHKQFNGGLPRFGTDPKAKILKFVNDSVPAGNAPFRILLAGTSIGGRVVVDVAKDLSSQGRPLRYVGIADAAFDNSSDPLLKAKFDAAVSQNIFQSITNNVIPGDEFHGSVDGFKENRDIGGNPLFSSLKRELGNETNSKKKRTEIDFIHKTAVVSAYAEIRGNLVSILRK
jgi:hypothetical protein